METVSHRLVSVKKKIAKIATHLAAPMANAKSATRLLYAEKTDINVMIAKSVLFLV